MPRESLLQQTDFQAWHAHSFQLIAFPVDAESVFREDKKWFETTVGIEPETTSKKFHRVDNGVIQDTIVTLTIELGKINWTMTANAIPADVPEGIPTIGPFLDAKSRFVSMINIWLDKCPQIYRLAFAGKAIRHTNSKEESYETLAKYLHWLEVDPVGSSEILYRINRKRKSTILSPRFINRLSLWSSLLMLTQQSLLSGFAQRNVLRRELHACSVDLDINTDPEVNDPIAKDMLVPLFSELSLLGTEILEKGDIV